MRQQIVVVLLMLCGIATAQSSPERASYRIAVGFSHGSGTGIARDIVVTNSHVVGHQAGVRARCWNDVSSVSATGVVIAVNRNADIAVIQTSKPVDWVLCQTEIQPATPTYRLGYGSSGQLVRVACKLHARDMQSRGVQWARLTVASQPGDSGGGVFQNGKLAGYLWGTQPSVDKTVAGDSWRIYELLKRYDSEKGQTLSTRIFGDGFCGPGGCAPGRSDPRREPVTIDPAPDPIAPPLQEIDLDDLAARVAKLLPKARDGANGTNGSDGKNGKDGRSIVSVSPGSPGELVFTFSDGKEQTVSGLGITFELVEPGGSTADREFIPLLGKLRLQQYIENIGGDR